MGLDKKVVVGEMTIHWLALADDFEEVAYRFGNQQFLGLNYNQNNGAP